MKLLHLLFRRLDRKIVLPLIGDIPSAPQHFRRLVHRLLQHIWIGLDPDIVLVSSGIQFEEGVVRDQDTAVLVAHSDSTLRFFHHADHLKIRAVDHHVFADRRTPGKQHRGNILSQHHNFLAVQFIPLGDEPSR